MSARRYTLTVRADDYGLMSAMSELAELIPGAETNWYVASDEALKRARLADELFPVTESALQRTTPEVTPNGPMFETPQTTFERAVLRPPTPEGDET